jgi:hypothetical protein
MFPRQNVTSIMLVPNTVKRVSRNSAIGLGLAELEFLELVVELMVLRRRLYGGKTFCLEDKIGALMVID